jgi:hypothetical protein
MEHLPNCETWHDESERIAGQKLHSSVCCAYLSRWSALKRWVLEKNWSDTRYMDDHRYVCS